MIRVSWKRTLNDPSKVTGIVTGYVSHNGMTFAVIVYKNILIERNIEDLSFEGWAE